MQKSICDYNGRTNYSSTSLQLLIDAGYLFSTTSFYISNYYLGFTYTKYIEWQVVEFK